LSSRSGRILRRAGPSPVRGTAAPGPRGRVVRGASPGGDPVVLREPALQPREAPAGSGEAAPAVSAEAALERARAEAEAIREAARAEGRREGLARGRAEARAELEGLLAELREVVASLRASREALLEALAPRILDAVVRAAGRVAGGAIAAEPDRLRAIVREALAQARDDERVVVRLHPDDLAALEPARAELERAASGELVLRADRSLVRGGCVVETSRGLVDARLDMKLAALHEALARDLNGGGGSL
jgi:flagellar assembly protein FliH